MQIIKKIIHNPKIIIGLVVVLALSLPFVIGQVLQQQDLRQRASGNENDYKVTIKTRTSSSSINQPINIGGPSHTVVAGDYIIAIVSAKGEPSSVTLDSPTGAAFTKVVNRKTNNPNTSDISIWYKKIESNTSALKAMVNISTNSTAQTVYYDIEGLDPTNPVLNSASYFGNSTGVTSNVIQVPVNAFILAGMTYTGDTSFSNIDFIGNPSFAKDSINLDGTKTPIIALSRIGTAVPPYSVPFETKAVAFSWPQAVPWAAVIAGFKPKTPIPPVGVMVPPCGVRGDVNNDGQINVADADMMKAELIGKTDWTADQLSRGDLNNDGIIDEANDYLILGTFIGGGGTNPSTFPACSGPTHEGLMFDNASKKIFTVAYNPGQNMETTNCTVIRTQTCQNVPNVTLYQGLGEGCMRADASYGPEELWKEIKCSANVPATPSPTPILKPLVCSNIGDADNDGKISEADALLVLKFIAGTATPTPNQITNSNVDNVDGITLNDALLIRRYIASNITTFPACPPPTATPTPLTGYIVDIPNKSYSKVKYTPGQSPTSTCVVETVTNCSDTPLISGTNATGSQCAKGSTGYAIFSTTSCPVVSLPTPTTIQKISVSVQTPTNITQSSAQVQATVTKPSEKLITTLIRYSTTNGICTGFTNTTPSTTHAAGQTTATYTRTLSNLQPNTTYYVCLESSENQGTAIAKGFTTPISFKTLAAGTTITITPPPSPTNVPPTATSVPACPLKSRGDANCDQKVDKTTDFVMWHSQYFTPSTPKSADFNGDNQVTILDFIIWKGGYADTTIAH